jgi:hypothetical protein
VPAPIVPGRNLPTAAGHSLDSAEHTSEHTRRERSMAFSAPWPVISGKPYRIRQVLGHDPHDLSDFAGHTTFVLDLDGQDYTVRGDGLRTDDGAQVYEKDDHGHGKDVRVWAIRHDAPSNSFTAEHFGPWPSHT